MLDGLVFLLLKFFYKIFLWILQGILNFIDPYFARAAEAVPHLGAGYGDALLEYIAVINYFIPLTWLLGLVIAYVTITLIVLAVQWIVKFIPTL